MTLRAWATSTVGGSRLVWLHLPSDRSISSALSRSSQTQSACLGLGKTWGRGLWYDSTGYQILSKGRPSGWPWVLSSHGDTGVSADAGGLMACNLKKKLPKLPEASLAIYNFLKTTNHAFCAGFLQRDAAFGINCTCCNMLIFSEIIRI